MTPVNQQITSTQAKYPGKIQLFRCPVCGQLSADRWIGSNMLTATERYEDCERDSENVWALLPNGRCGSPACQESKWVDGVTVAHYQKGREWVYVDRNPDGTLTERADLNLDLPA